MEVTITTENFRELQEWRTAIGSRFVGDMVRFLAARLLLSYQNLLRSLTAR